MSRQRVRDWVRQFGPEQEELALKVVEAVKVFGRVETNAALEGFLSSERGKTFQGGFVVPIGQPKDGSSIVGYHAVDVARTYACEVVELSVAINADKPIVLVDDFIGRGSSTISIIEALVGASSKEDLHEDRPPALSAEIVDLFKARSIAFVYTAGLADGPERLRGRLRELDFRNANEIHVSTTQEDLPSVNGCLAGVDADLRRGFIDRARQVGGELMVGVPTERKKERLLGYGNHGLLVVFPYNTPTASLTALWASGTVDGWPWFPLAPRRKKL